MKEERKKQARETEIPIEEETSEFYLRYYIGHKGKFSYEFLEFEFRPDGKLRYANNSNYKNDTIIRKEVYDMVPELVELVVKDEPSYQEGINEVNDVISNHSTKPKYKEGFRTRSILDILVSLITKAQKHPDADSLYVEDIDVGEGREGQTRTVNRKVCVLCNLKPANMRGIKSEAMVLAASNSDHTTVELVEPPEGAQVGERVAFPGFVGEPDEILNPKKKVWETLQVDLHTNTELVACYKDVPLTTSAGVCTVSSIAGGSIK